MLTYQNIDLKRKLNAIMIHNPRLTLIITKHIDD